MSAPLLIVYSAAWFAAGAAVMAWALLREAKR